MPPRIRLFDDGMFGLDAHSLQLERLVQYAGLDQCSVVVTLCNGDTETPFRSDSLKNPSLCVPQVLYPRFAPNFLGLENIYDSNWDYCIALSRAVSGLHRFFPAYFSFVVGHEFARAAICNLDLWLFVHCRIVAQSIGLVKNRPVDYSHELPDEAVCDRFGLFVAGQFHGLPALYREIEILLGDANRNDKKRLRVLLDTKQSAEIDSKRIGRDLVALCAPYRAELEGIWYQQSVNKNLLISLVDHYDWLFDAALYR